MPKAAPARRARPAAAAKASANSNRGARGASPRDSSPGRRPARPVVVGAALVVALGLTTGLLSWLSPTPLMPDVAGRLMAAGPSTPAGTGGTSRIDFGPIFRTRVALRPGRWRALHVRHSGTDAGDARALAELARERGVSGPPDHFVICNGRGGGDGEIQFTPRWDAQQPPAGAPADCVSVCLIGDFDRARPTEAQLRSLRELITVLEREAGIPGQAVRVTTAGRYFPPGP